MRKFTMYAPRQIARYVLTFFKGDFLIEGLGRFHFDGGRVVCDARTAPEQRGICAEINNAIARLSSHGTAPRALSVS
ncbi:MAG: DUF1107 domain-containing protein [Succinivibrionaceae bacterium]|nr:DUF1107 domain-containing protein [Succinivibrionaceae bacterium]